MSFQLITDWDRPNRFEVKSRGPKYHTDWGRYAIANGFNMMHYEHLNQMNLNTNFFFDRQWLLEEDLEAFFKDSTNQSRNRLKVVKNFIKPTILQYMGNAVIMDMTIRARSISPRAANRREDRLSELVLLTESANRSNPEYKEFLRSKYPLGSTKEETEQLFEHLYKDDFVVGINYFMEYIAEENKLDSKKIVAAFDLTRSGLALLEYYVHNNEFKWRRLLPEQFFFDRTALEPDLSDAGYMGKYQEMLPSQIFERWNSLGDREKRAIEDEAKRTGNLTTRDQVGNVGGKIHTYTTYWKDFEDQEFGYVMDEFDYPYMARLNHTYPNETHPRFTDKDLIPKENLNDDQKKILRGKNKAVVPMDIMRYVEFIPHEIVSVPYIDSLDGRSDIVLAHGIFPYQDTENEKVDSVMWPIKASTWIYHKGYIDTPVSSLVSPQRMINRYASVEEQQVSSSHGQTLFYDSSIVTGDDGEAEMLTNMYQGKPTGVDTKGQGLHNMMGEFGAVISKDVLIYENLQSLMKDSMDNIIGINNTMRGESQAANKLVGVTQLEIQRSSLIQEPFYDALVKLFLQVYQATANVGKRVYVANKRKLAIAIGDTYTTVLQLTNEYNAEDFRAFIAREPDKKLQQQAVNEILFMLKDKDLIDEIRLSELFNKGTFEEVGSAMKAYAKEKMMMAKEQVASSQQSEEAGAVQEETMRQETREDAALSEAGKFADNEQNRRSKELQNREKFASNERIKTTDGTRK